MTFLYSSVSDFLGMIFFYTFVFYMIFVFFTGVEDAIIYWWRFDKYEPKK